MPGTFFGLNIAYTGLVAAQAGQDVTGHNIANADTEGYSVQSLDQVAGDPWTSADLTSLPRPGSLGSGVAVSGIGRASDQFLNTQVRDATASHSFQTSQSDALQQVDAAFGEPSDTGLNAALGKFFHSFQDLANNPEDKGIRATTIQSGAALASVFSDVGARLVSVHSGVSGRISSDVQAVNDASRQIAALNVTIRQETVQGQQPNDLLDQRDLLVDKLSGLANITTQNNPDGTVNVSVGNVSLVQGLTATPVTLTSLTAKGDLQSGELAGLGQAQTAVTGYQGQLDTLASAVVSQVNAVHSEGYALDGTTTGTNFFNPAGTTAATIGVNPQLEADPGLLAAAGPPTPPATAAAPGDGSNAVLLAGLKDKTDTNPADPLFNTTLQGYYQGFVSDAGGKAASAKTASGGTGASLTQLTQQRQSATGVSTDQEMVNMMKYQRAYQASARVVQTMDDMIGTLINNLFSAR